MAAVVLHIRDRGGVLGLSPRGEPDEGGLVQTSGGCAVQPFAISGEQVLTLSSDSVVDRPPVTGELGGHVGDNPTTADLDRRPAGRPRGLNKG